MGKTRLALEFAEECQAIAWRYQVVGEGEETAALTTAQALEQPVLLIIDYAETRVGLEDLLTRLARLVAEGNASGVRVLLLARQAGEWWDLLGTKAAAAVRDLVAATPVAVLSAALDEGVSAEDVAAEAVPCFARVLGTPAPSVQFMVTDGRRLPVLVLHAAALLAVLDSQADGGDGSRAMVDMGVLAALLGHEGRLWVDSAEQAGLGLALTTIKQVMAAVALLGGRDEDQVRHVLMRVPDLADAGRERLGRISRWLRELYPGRDYSWLEPLRPDLLAEHHCATQLAASESLRRGCLTDLDSEQAEYALTVLVRACAHHDAARKVLATALADDLEHLALPAVAVAVQTGVLLGDLLARALEETSASLEHLQTIAKVIPYPSIALADASAVTLTRICDFLSAGVDHDDRARWTGQLAVALSQIGRREEALATIEEATGLYRTLTATQPGAYLSALAMSLNNQSTCLADLGRREDALAAIEEAVGIRRTLASRPGADPELARSLNNQAIRLMELGRREEALAAIEEAAAIRRTLAETRPAFLPDLAVSLINQSNCLAGVGRREDALAAIEEATALYRALAETRPDAFLPDLAASLINQSTRLADLGRREDALAAIEEAVGIRRTLAETRPDAFLPDFAASLINQSIRMAGVGRREDALAAIEEATALYRALAETRPDAFLPELAGSLNNYSNCLAGVGRREDALAAIEEATALYRALAETRPDAFLPELAASLNNYSNRFASLGRAEEGLAAIEEAVGIRRTLAETRPDAFLPDLAASLNNYSIRFTKLDRQEEALAAIEEAVGIRRTLAETRPNAFLPDLAASLINQSTCLADLGRREEALAAIEEATTLYRTLAETRPDAFLPGFAVSLNNQSTCLADLGRREEALAAIEEAVGIRRALAETRPNAFLSDLAMSLNNQSTCLADLGRREEALAAIEEAVGIRRALAETRPNAFLPDLATSLTVKGMVLLQNEKAAESAPFLIESLEIATERDLKKLISTVVSLLRAAYQESPRQVTQTWLNLKGSNPPEWMEGG
ncbi:tetratricopeptide repeat protein [Microbispora rosea]|uniref:tetratricopeptide repeat protein n=1 Tax=Microbispora rosea TaxID=58117 RepID=UPI00379FB913